MRRLVWETPPNRKVKVQFWREGKTGSVVITTGAQPVRATASDFADGWRPLMMSPSMSDFPVPLLAWRNLGLGLECEPMGSQLAAYFGVKEGVLIRYVEPGSVSEKAGLKVGDVIVTVGERPISVPRDVSGCLRQQATPGKPVAVCVVRAHKRLTVNMRVPAE